MSTLVGTYQNTPYPNHACKLKTDTKNTGAEIPLSQYERIASALEEGAAYESETFLADRTDTPPILPLYNKC